MRTAALPARAVAARALAAAALAAATAAGACGGSGADDQVTEGACQIADRAAAPDDLETITCKADFDALGSLPIDATLPSATSVKLVLDQFDSDHLYFQNSVKYQIHYRFVATHLSGNGLPIVGDLGTFNSTEYFSPDRRFVLGAITYYALPDRWVLELSPYDTASAALIEKLFRRAARAGYFGPRLAFHPTSEALAAVAAELPRSVPVVSTDELYAGIDYQPLSLGAAVGTLHFTTAAKLAAGELYSPYTILVLDSAPNDLSVVQGTITEEFQTPLSHINVLAHTRHAPNMGLRDAAANATLRGLAEQLVKLTTTAGEWTIAPISAAEAQAFWAAHAPAPVALPTVDLSVTAITDIAAVTPEPAAGQTLLGNLRKAITAFGGKASHYSILARTDGVPIRPAFAIPIYHYDKFMRSNGFRDRIIAMLADPAFRASQAVRNAALAQLRADILVAPFDPALVSALTAKIAANYASASKLKFRSSSNSEDLEGFPCAGCYDSFAGKTSDTNDMLTAIRRVYASAWEFRTFELRSYYGVDHLALGMAILGHEYFDDELANGVAVTGNPFDASGLDPAYYINVQAGGDVEVVAPPPGVASDQILYYFGQPNQPTTYLAHSSLIEAGTTVLTPAQLYELGRALQRIHERLSPAYGPAAGNTGWYALEVDFKFTPSLYIKQARWYPDPNGGTP